MKFLNRSPVLPAEPRAAGSVPARAPAGAPRREPGAADVEARLKRHGASQALLERVLSGIERSGAHGAFAIDAAARALGSGFRVRASPRRTGRAHVVAFVGPTGAGKTTSLAKLGRKLSAAGRRVLYASLDPLGLAALESVKGLAADVDRTEVPLRAVQSSQDLRRVLSGARDADVVLLDTPGLSPRDPERID